MRSQCYGDHLDARLKTCSPPLAGSASPPHRCPASPYPYTMDNSNSAVITVWSNNYAILYNGSWSPETISSTAHTSSSVHVARQDDLSVSLMFSGE